MSDITTVISALCQLAICLFSILDLKANLYLHPMESSRNNGVIGGSLRICHTREKIPVYLYCLNISLIPMLKGR